ncbi:fimbrial protein [Citrobacter freundii complex sp. CFNIH2]|uniref:fimbrial protein n=1 Tax=Citrobacter freundii complex sp. CFNIH2 TaxID=2066049 RepID=UPI000C86D8A0|nr:fimbrial protein [Citrobacter freundii complex sp. CFNIH2]
MIRKLIQISTVLIAISAIFFCSKTMAFSCTFNGVNIFNKSGTFTVSVDAPTLDKSVVDTIITDMSSYATCGGGPTNQYQDALRSTELTISPVLSNLGYSAYITMSGNKYRTQPVCLWPDNACSVYMPDGSNIELPINAKLGVELINSGKWEKSTIPAGTELMRMVTQMRTYATWEPWYITWIFKLKNDLVIPNYTCSLDEDFVNQVILPSVDAFALKKNGPGRFKDVEKTFSFNFTCDPQTAVTVKFDGETINNLDDVLKNSEEGNDNVGIQLLYNDTPLKIGDPLQVISSAQSRESLSFQADYYYKGGDVSAGKVHSSAVFTFDYK